MISQFPINKLFVTNNFLAYHLMRHDPENKRHAGRVFIGKKKLFLFYFFKKEME